MELVYNYSSVLHKVTTHKLCEQLPPLHPSFAHLTGAGARQTGQQLLLRLE
jgi:hypothetical protein